MQGRNKMEYTSKSIISLATMIEKDHTGKLWPVEPPELPFEIARIFWTSDVPPRGIRGGHAHIKCRQFYICMKGCIDIHWNDGDKSGEYYLKEGQAALIDTLVWTQETFMTGDDLLLVLCSSKYNSADYINTVEKLKEYKENESKR